MTPPIGLLLVDDHAAYRRPLAMLFAREPGIIVVAQAGTVAEVRKALATTSSRIDLALVDLHLPDGDGVDVVHYLHGVNPRAQAIVLTAVLDSNHHRRAIAAGAARVLSKSVHPTELVAQVRSAHAGMVEGTAEILAVPPGPLH